MNDDISEIADTVSIISKMNQNQQCFDHSLSRIIHHNAQHQPQIQMGSQNLSQNQNQIQRASKNGNNIPHNSSSQDVIYLPGLAMELNRKKKKLLQEEITDYYQMKADRKKQAIDNLPVSPQSKKGQSRRKYARLNSIYKFEEADKNQQDLQNRNIPILSQLISQICTNHNDELKIVKELFMISKARLLEQEKVDVRRSISKVEAQIRRIKIGFRGPADNCSSKLIYAINDNKMSSLLKEKAAKADKKSPNLGSIIKNKKHSHKFEILTTHEQQSKLKGIESKKQEQERVLQLQRLLKKQAGHLGGNQEKLAFCEKRYKQLKKLYLRTSEHYKQLKQSLVLSSTHPALDKKNIICQLRQALTDNSIQHMHQSLMKQNKNLKLEIKNLEDKIKKIKDKSQDLAAKIESYNQNQLNFSRHHFHINQGKEQNKLSGDKTKQGTLKYYKLQSATTDSFRLPSTINKHEITEQSSKKKLKINSAHQRYETDMSNRLIESKRRIIGQKDTTNENRQKTIEDGEGRRVKRLSPLKRMRSEDESKSRY